MGAANLPLSDLLGVATGAFVALGDWLRPPSGKLTVEVVVMETVPVGEGVMDSAGMDPHATHDAASRLFMSAPRATPRYPNGVMVSRSPASSKQAPRSSA